MAKLALEANIEKYKDRVKVVMTHHMPSAQLTAPHYMDNPFNGVFSCTDMESVIEDVDVWVYGHTHDPYDLEMLGTRMVCNPRGYPFENTGFDPVKVIEI